MLMETIGLRIKTARVALADKTGERISQKKLAQMCGWEDAQSRVGNYENNIRKPSPEDIQRIAKVTGFRAEWLLYGAGPKTEEVPADAGLRRVRMSPREIVVLNYVQAGHPKEVIDDYAPGDGMERIYVDEESEKRLGPYAFALIVEGDSMETEYREGDRVLIDPAAPVRPGDVVVAKLDKCDAATLKQYRSRGDDEQGCPMFELVPFNNNYPTELVSSKNPGQIIGPVIEHTRKVRR